MNNLLKQYTSLRSEREEVEKRIEKLDKALQKIIEEGTVKDSVKGGVGGIQHFVIEGFPTSDYNTTRKALIKQKKRLTKLDKDIVEKLDIIHSLVNSIDNSEIRRIITYRYIYGYTWDKTAKTMGPMHNDEEIRKTAIRFLEKS